MIPSFCILDCSVVRLIPSLAAAPVAPAITPPDSLSAVRICWRSISSNCSAGVFGASRRACQRGPEIGERNLELRARRKNDGTLDQVLQLANVARPERSLQRVHRGARNDGDAALERPRKLVDEMMDERGNIVRPFAQRRHLDGKDIQPVVEIAAEQSIGDHLLEIAVRRRDQPHVNPLSACAPQPLELLFLQCAQQLRLNLRAGYPPLRRETACRGWPAPDGRSCWWLLR